jgi:hypothetical protein
MTKNSKDKGRKWDGKSRVSTDLYRKNFDEIFKKKSQPDPFKIEVKEDKKPSKKELKELDDRNGF